MQMKEEGRREKTKGTPQNSNEKRQNKINEKETDRGKKEEKQITKVRATDN